jgi:hypothetical protein
MSYYADRVFEVTFGTGTGNLLLGGSQPGYITWFLAFGVGVARPYVIEQPGTSDYEIGNGTVVDNGDGTYSLARSVVKSSNANALVAFASGTKYVRATLPAADLDSFRAGATLAGTAIQKDGSVAFTGDQSLGGHKLTNVATLNKIAFTQPATGATITPADGSTLTTVGAYATTLNVTGATNITLPTTGTMATLAGAETLLNKTLTAPIIATINNGGTVTIPAGPETLVGRSTTDVLVNKTLTAPIIASINNGGTVTIPAGPETLVGRSTTDTLVNKTLTAPIIATINNGGTVTIPTGPTTLVGRDTTDTLTNKSIDAGQLTGSIVAARMPALTGDVTSSAGSVSTTIAANAVSYSKLQQIAAVSLVGNATGSTANATGITLGSSLTFSGSTVNAIQGIRTADSPTFTSITLGLGTGIAGPTINGGASSAQGAYMNWTKAGGQSALIGHQSAISGGTSNDLLIYSANNNVSIAPAAGVTITFTPTTFTLTDAVNIVGGTTTGHKLGTATGQKWGIWNATPIVQPTAAGQAAMAAQGQSTLTDSTGGTPSTTLAAIAAGAAYAQADMTATKNALASLAARFAEVKTDVANVRTLVDAMRTAMVNFGSMKGS